MKCSKCGEEGHSLTIFVNAATMKTDYICSKCQASGMAKSIQSLEEIEELIADYEEISARLEDIIRQHPEMPNVPKGLAAFAHTPMTSYRDVQTGLAELKYRRMELLAAKDGEYRIQYDLKKALATEDYEKAAALQLELEKLQPNKKTKTKKS